MKTSKTGDDSSDPTGLYIPGVPEGPIIPGASTPLASGNVPVPPQADVPPREKRRIIVTHLEPAMLTHRVEPIYPPLAKQIHREGKVELRAIIVTDGSIQSLEVISGDPLLVQSALDAVRGWRYRPTVLNGQAVEIDTHITVIYSLSR